MTPQKVGRTVASVEISWAVKGEGAKAAAARELKGHSADRKARRTGKAETVADTAALPPFPRSGGFTYSLEWQNRFTSIWSDLGRPYDERPDTARVADHVRRIAQDQGLAPDSPQIGKLLENVLKNWKKG